MLRIDLRTNFWNAVPIYTEISILSPRVSPLGKTNEPIRLIFNTEVQIVLIDLCSYFWDTVPISTEIGIFPVGSAPTGKRFTPYDLSSQLNSCFSHIVCVQNLNVLGQLSRQLSCYRTDGRTDGRINWWSHKHDRVGLNIGIWYQSGKIK